MNELDKIKIGFAIALLAGLFTIQPLIEKSSLTFIVFTLNFKVTTLYWIFASLLAFSVYFYALALIKFERISLFFQGAGNWTYAISLLFPPFVLTIYLISLITQLISPLINSENVTQIISMLLGIVSSITTSFFITKTQAKFKSEENKLNAEKIKMHEFESLEKARALYKSNYFDMVLIELWKTLEYSFERVFLMKAIPYSKANAFKIIETIRKNNLLPKDLIEELERIRNLRNKSAHPNSDLPITEVQASTAINNTEKILIAIENYKEQCYFCQNEFPLTELEVEDINGDYYACKDCIKKHPNWKEEILSLGMD